MTYIEDEAPADSLLAQLRAERLAPSEKRRRCESCIDETLGEWLQRNKTRAITESYFNCVVGIKQRLKTHLERLFTPETEPVALLFEQQVEGKSLYDLRHTIAHGAADALSAGEMEGIHQRIWNVERIAAQYILSVFKKALGMQPLSEGITLRMAGLFQSAIVSSEQMYRGPTDMASLYF